MWKWIWFSKYQYSLLVIWPEKWLEWWFIIWVIMPNVRSPAYGMDELAAWARCQTNKLTLLAWSQNEYLEFSLMCFTKTWLHAVVWPAPGYIWRQRCLHHVWVFRGSPCCGERPASFLCLVRMCSCGYNHFYCTFVLEHGLISLFIYFIMIWYNCHET